MSMKILTLSFVAITGFCHVVAGHRSGSTRQLDSEIPSRASEKVPNSFIVEFDRQAASNVKRDGKNVHDLFHQHLTDALSRLGKGTSYSTQYTWDHQLFSGAAVRMDHSADAALLKTAPGVRAVTQSRRHFRTASNPVVPSTDMVEALTKKNLKTQVKRDSTIPLNDTFAPHKMTGVDKLHAQGLFGENITVGIIDTGIDYTLATLNGGLGDGTPCFAQPGCQVTGGYDFVGDNYTFESAPQPDDDPLDQCAGHGTHVAGTIAARDDGRGFTGVAPLANIKAYRIFGCDDESGTTTDVIIEAMLHAFNDGVDIISMSVGGSSGWKEAPESLLASRIAAKGIPFFVSAGNDGSVGTMYASEPAAGELVTGVGSIDSIEIGGYTVSTVGQQGDPRNFLFLMANPWNETGTLPLKALTTDPSVTDDACDPDEVAKAGDLSEYIVIVGRGTCLFSEKIANIQAAGAKRAIIYTTPSPDSINLPVQNSPDFEVAGLFREDGIYLLKQLAAGAQIGIDLSHQVATAAPNTVTGGLTSSFSTFGLPWELDISTKISAPGGNILSSWPRPLGSYAILSGTSMACPFMAGSAALYRSAVKNGKSLGAVEQAAVFSSTASPVAVLGAPDLLNSVAQAGGGLVDVYAAVMHTSEVSPAALGLNDTRHFAGQQTVTITNVGAAAQTYQISHKSAWTLTSVNTTTGEFNMKPITEPIASAPATVTFDKASLTIPAGGSDQFTATFAAPEGLDPHSISIYSGFLVAESDDPAGSVSVMYAGVAADLYTESVLDRTATNSPTDAPLPVMTDNTGSEVIDDDSHVFTLQQNNGTLDAPALVFGLRLGSASWTLDLVSADSNTSQMARRHRMVRRHKSTLHQRSSNSSTPAGPVYGNVDSEAYEPRTLDALLFPLDVNVTVQDGQDQKPIEDGDYQLFLRVAKLFGDLNDENDYETYLSPKFTIKRSG